MLSIKGKVALVTGGGRGIGRGTAIALAKYGAKVAVVARTSSEINAVVEEIQTQGGDAIAIQADISKLEDVQRAVNQTIETLGSVDILVNNAALLGEFNLIENTDPDSWLLSQQVNIMGAYYFMRETIAQMKDKGYGRIINVTSGAARGLARATAYSASKAALDALTIAVATEKQGTGVCAVALSPGTVDTEMQTEVRNQPAERVGEDRHAYFTNLKETNQLSNPMLVGEQIVAVILTDKTGEIVPVYDMHDELAAILEQAQSK